MNGAQFIVLSLGSCLLVFILQVKAEVGSGEMLGGDLTAGSGSGSMPKASSPPMLTRLTPKTIFLDSSEKSTFTAMVSFDSGNPPGNVEWFKDREAIDTLNNSRLTVVTNGTLSILSVSMVQSQDRGLYTVSLTSTVGNDSASFKLFVQYFEIIETRSSLNNPSTVRLSCIAESYPEVPSISWQSPDGVDINSTSVVHEHSEFDTTVSVTLDVARINCTNEQFVCLFQTDNVSLSSSLVCPPVPEVVFESSTYTVNEEDGNLQVCVLINNATNCSQIKFVVTDITATRGRDFILLKTFSLTVDREQLTTELEARELSGALILSGRMCFNITIIQDFLFEQELETFGLEVRAKDDVVRSSSETTIYIIDKNELVIGLERERYVFNEPNSGLSSTVVICARTSRSIVGLPIEFTLIWRHGSATDTVDYILPPCDFAFPPGTFLDCMDLTLINDNIVENTENLTVEIGSLFVNGIQVWPGDTSRVYVDIGGAVIEIVDQDAIELAFEEATYTIQEGGPGEDHVALVVCLVQRGDGAHTIDLIGGDFLTVNVTLNTQDGTAIAGRDFAKVRYTSSVHLPFSTFDVSTGLCECVDIVRDRVVERTEYFDLHLQSTHPLVRTTDSRVFVRDNPIGVTIGFERTEYTVSENEGVFEVCIVLTGSYERSISVFLCSENGTATEDIDYGGVRSLPLLFFANPHSPSVSGGRRCVNVTVLDDEVIEEDEAFKLILQSRDPAVTFVSGSSTSTVHITSDDSGLPSLQFVSNTPSVRGNEVTVDFFVSSSHLVSSISCVLEGPGKTPTMTQECSLGHVTFSALPLRRQQFILTVTAWLKTFPPATLLLSEVAFRLDHDVCWLHPINRGITVNNSLVMVEWQSTGPTADNRVTQFLCRRDRESIEEPCTSPYVWNQPASSFHTLSVRPAQTPGCRRHITRRFTFTGQ